MTIDEDRHPRPNDDPGLEARWRRRFEERGLRYHDDAAIAGWSATGLDGRFRRFRGLWEPPTGTGHWLDVGCGAGTYARFLHQHGLHVTGVDYSLPSLLQARARAPDIHWCVADVRRLPVPPASVDGVLCFGVMQALSDPRVPLAELAGCLRGGGEIWIDGLNRWCLPTLLRETLRRLRGRPPHLRYDRPATLRRMLHEAGVENVRIHWLPLMPGRLSGLQAVVEARPVTWLLACVPPLGALLSHSFLLRGTRMSTPAPDA